MTIQTTLARRYLAGRKIRTFLTTLAIMFGVLVIFGMNTMLPAFVRAFQANTLAAAGEVDATITLKTGDVFDAALLDKVAGVEGVRAVSGFLNRAVNLPPDYFDSDPAAPDPTSVLAVTGIDLTQATAVHAYTLRDGRFLILPHAEVLTFWQRKTADIERWLRGMRRLRAKVMGTA